MGQILPLLLTPRVSPLTDTVSRFTFSSMLTFQDVLNHFGGTHEDLAKALNITRTAVTMWAGEIPEHRAYQIEVITRGKLRFRDLPVKKSGTH